MQIIQEMKQVQRQFLDISQSLCKAAKMQSSGAANAQNINKQATLEMQHRIEAIWIKAERVNTEMIRTFSQLIAGK